MLSPEVIQLIRRNVASREEEFCAWVDRVKPGYNKPELDQIEQEFGPKARARAEKIIADFWGKVTFGL